MTNKKSYSLALQVRLFSIMFLLIWTVNSSHSRADSFMRKVEFEWEQIENAVSYDIEIKQMKGSSAGGVMKFKASENKWQGSLSPGSYTIRLRSRDSRKVAGDWSADSELIVGLDNTKMILPKPNALLESKESKNESVKFQWKAVGGAAGYKFTLESIDKKTKISESIKATDYEIKIPVAAKYIWTISAFDSDGHESEAVSQANFTVTGAPLPAPKIEKPESEYVRNLQWSTIDDAQEYHIELYRFDKTTNKWKETLRNENSKATKTSFLGDWPGGNYQFRVKAKGDLRKESPWAKTSFKVKNGSRSPASEFQALIKKSIERVQGWYGIASYLITQVVYEGKNYETSGIASFTALGGTGRLGLGWVKEDSNWGFLTIADLSGFLYNGANHTFASLEANSTYTLDFGNRTELRFQLGGFMKEIPDITPDPVTQSVAQESKISSIGPHIGAEYWYSMTPKLGLQANTHIYYGMFASSTPNGQALVPAMSYQIGFMGSYKLSEKLTGLMGYAHRMDKGSYKAQSGGNSFANGGDVNEAVITGDYLNFFAEWKF